MAQQQAPPFAMATQINELQLPTLSYAASTPSFLEIPKVGYLAGIGADCAFTVTTGATGVYANSTTRTKVGGVTPYSAISRVKLLNNQANEIYSTTLWGNYLWLRTSRDGFDYRNIPTSFGAETDAVYNLAAGSAVSTAYTYRLPFWIPIALKPSLQGGLLLTQNDYTRYTLVVEWGDIATNIITTSGTTPSITVGTAVVNPWVRFFNAPRYAASQPDISQVHMVKEVTADITGTGTFTYRPQIGPIYLKNIHELVNNGAGMGVATATNVQTSYAATMYPLNLQARQALWRHTDWYGMAFPQGVFVHDYMQASGITRYSDARDWIDTSRITELQYLYNIAAGTTLSSAYIRSIEEQFVPAT